MRKVSRNFDHGGTCHMVEEYVNKNIGKCELRSAQSKRDLEFEITISLGVRNCDFRNSNHNQSNRIIE